MDETEKLRERITELEGIVNRMADLMEERVTIRDQFAMAALMGLMASDAPLGYNYRGGPGTAYCIADAMMEARKQ